MQASQNSGLMFGPGVAKVPSSLQKTAQGRSLGSYGVDCLGIFPLALPSFIEGPTIFLLQYVYVINVSLMVVKELNHVNSLLCRPDEKLIKKLRPFCLRLWQHWASSRNGRTIPSPSCFCSLFRCSEHRYGMRDRNPDYSIPYENPQPDRGKTEAPSKHPSTTSSNPEKGREDMMTTTPRTESGETASQVPPEIQNPSGVPEEKGLKTQGKRSFTRIPQTGIKVFLGAGKPLATALLRPCLSENATVSKRKTLRTNQLENHPHPQRSPLFGLYCI